MSSTFLELTNKLLRRLGEVELTIAEFPSARNVQSAAKDFIIDALDEIDSIETEWMFNQQTTTQLLTIGQEEYALPTSPIVGAVVNWESFRVVKDGTYNLGRTTPLVWIKRDEYVRYLEGDDRDAGVSGLRMPRFIAPGIGKTFLVSPSPDKTYTVAYDYFAKSPRMTLYDDTHNIPVEYDYVVIEFALKNFYMNKDNIALAQEQRDRANRALTTMRHTQANIQDYMTSSMSNFGGYQTGNDYVGDI